MPEGRKFVRNLVLKTGAIVCGTGERIVCAVLNLSDNGACLLVASTENVPDSFDVVLDPDGKTHSCRLAWKSMTKIGVSFSPACVVSSRE